MKNNSLHVSTVVAAAILCLALAAGRSAAIDGDEGWSDQFGDTDLVGYPMASVGDTDQLILGGSFSVIDDLEVMNVARFDGTHWFAMGEGFDGRVEGLIFHQGDPVACGLFLASGNVLVNHVARWSGAHWLPIGDGVNDAGGGLAEYAGSLHCGRFRWNGACWTELDLPSGSIRDMIAFDDGLYFCGAFTDSAGSPISSVVVWDGDGWQEVGELDDEPENLVVYQGSLVVSTPEGSSCIQRFRDGAWESLLDSEWAHSFGHPVAIDDRLHIRTVVCSESAPCRSYVWRYSDSGMDWEELAFANVHMSSLGLLDNWNDRLLMSGDIVVSGLHEKLVLQNSDGVAPLLARPRGVAGEVRELHDGPDLLISGDFGEVGNFLVNNTAFWDGDNWYGIAGSDYVNSWIITTYKTAWCGDAYKSTHRVFLWPPGSQDDATTLPYTDSLARWTGSAWSSISFYTEFTKLHAVASQLYASSEEGLVTIDPDLSFSAFAEVSGGHVKDLCEFQGGMAAGGDFDAIDGVPLPGVGRFMDGQWTGLGDLSGNIVDLTTHGGELAVTGIVAIGTETPRRGVAMWNGLAWRRLGDAFNDSIHCLESYEGALYAGGSFTSVGGQPASKIAYWQGLSWRPVGAGIQGNRINDMEVHDGALWVGGKFVGAGDHRATNICTWAGIATPVLLQSFEARREEGNISLYWRCAGGPQGTFRVVRVMDGSHAELVAEVPADGGSEWSCVDRNPVSGPRSYSLFLRDADGEELQLAEAGLDAEVLPQSLRLSSPRPNPFNPTVTVQLIAPVPATVDIAVYDMQGRRLRALLGGPVAAGDHPFTWDGRDDAGRSVGSGTYFVRLEVDGRSEAVKILLAR